MRFHESFMRSSNYQTKNYVKIIVLIVLGHYASENDHIVCVTTRKSNIRTHGVSHTMVPSYIWLLSIWYLLPSSSWQYMFPFPCYELKTFKLKKSLCDGLDPIGHRGERIIRYSNDIRISKYSYSYSVDIFKPNNIRIRIRVIFSNRIIFVFVFRWFFQTK